MPRNLRKGYIPDILQRIAAAADADRSPHLPAPLEKQRKAFEKAARHHPPTKYLPAKGAAAAQYQEVPG